MNNGRGRFTYVESLLLIYWPLLRPSAESFNLQGVVVMSIAHASNSPFLIGQVMMVEMTANLKASSGSSGRSLAASPLIDCGS